MAGKLVKGTMDVRKIVLLFVLMISVSSFSLVSSGRKQAVDSLDNMVKTLSLNCGLDPTSIRYYIEELDISFAEGIVTDSRETNFRHKLYGERWEASSPPSPEIKYILLDCLSKHNIFNQVSDEDNPRNKYAEYLSSFTISRRYLADEPIMSPMRSLAPAPVLAPAPSPSPFPRVETPDLSPSSSPLTGPDDGLTHLSPPPIHMSVSPPIAEGPMHDKGAVVLPEKHHNNKNTVVIAVCVTAAGVIVLALLLFCCCRCFRKSYVPANGHKDESPLLNLSMSDYSGSSYGYAGSIQKDKTESSAKIESNLHGHIITFNGSGESLASGLSDASSIGIEPASSSHQPLRPPPGRNPAAPPTAPTPVPPPAPPPAPPSAPPPPPPKPKPGPPPPPSKASTPPRPPPAGSSYMKAPRPLPLGPNRSNNEDADTSAPKTKLKPLFWDKVSTNPDKSMVWNEIKSGSFQFNEEMIETLFGYRNDDKGKAEGKKGSVLNDPSQYIQLLDPKKSQNLAISLKAMNIKVDEISDALMEGNELPPELLQTLLKMAPTTDEELKIRLYSGDPSLLGPGEQFLKVIIDIPFAFKRMDALLFITSLPEEVTSMKESFASLEVACKELRSSRLFLKLLEAVLKLGNRMNDGTFRGGAQAFKLDTLLKLSDVKGTDGKTTLLHFVVQEIIRSEGARSIRLAKENQNSSTLSLHDLTFEDSEDNYQTLGLEIVSSLSTELGYVKKAAGLDADALTHTVASLGHELVKTKEFLNTEMRSTEEDSGFHRLLKSFVEHAEVDITFLLEEEKRIRSLVKNTTDYFHGKSGRDEGLRMFVIVRDFLGMIDKACREVRESQKKVVKVPRSMDNPALAQTLEQRKHLFPAIRDRRVDSSSSDDDDDYES